MQNSMDLECSCCDMALTCATVYSAGVLVSFVGSPCWAQIHGTGRIISDLILLSHFESLSLRCRYRLRTVDGKAQRCVQQKASQNTLLHQEALLQVVAHCALRAFSPS